jgi:hypothetical protein
MAHWRDRWRASTTAGDREAADPNLDHERGTAGARG